MKNQSFWNCADSNRFDHQGEGKFEAGFGGGGVICLDKMVYTQMQKATVGKRMSNADIIFLQSFGVTGTLLNIVCVSES